MRKANWMFALMLAAALSSLGWAQGKTDTTRPMGQSSKTAASEPASKSGEQGALDVRAGTKISATLQTALDARTAKPGEEVVARVTKNVKQAGRTVIHKGDRLVGHVLSAQASESEKAGSQINVAFDQLAQGSAMAQLNTVVSGVFAATTAAPAEDELAPMPGPEMQPMPASGGGSSGGGLVGGAAGAVGSTVNSTVGAAGSATQGVGQGVGGAVSGATSTVAGANAGAGAVTPIAAIHLNSMADASQQNQFNSVFSTRRGGLRLASGTQMQFRVAGSADVSRPKK